MPVAALRLALLRLASLPDPDSPGGRDDKTSRACEFHATRRAHRAFLGESRVTRESTMSVLNTTVRRRPAPHTYVVPVVREIVPKRPDLAWTTW
jgi:hypothetical protein